MKRLLRLPAALWRAGAAVVAWTVASSPDLLELAGAALIAGGIALYWLPAGMIAAGFALVVMANQGGGSNGSIR